MSADRIRFFSGGLAVAGRLHRPTAAPPWPILVQGPGWMETVCSKVSEPFHLAFQEAGYAVLQYDTRGWGESEGERGWVRPEQQLEDLLNAITYAASLGEVDPTRLGLFGLGGTGGGNAIIAAALDIRVRAVAVQTVVADGEDWLHRMRREYEWVAFLKRVESNRRHRVLHGVGEMVDPTVDLMVGTPERLQAGMPLPPEPFHLASAEFLMRYRPIDYVHLIAPRAVLITCVERDVVTPEDHAVALFERAGAPKRLVRQTGISHYEAYTANHSELMSQFLSWYGRHLCGGRLEIRESSPSVESVTLGGVAGRRSAAPDA